MCCLIHVFLYLSNISFLPLYSLFVECSMFCLYIFIYSYFYLFLFLASFHCNFSILPLISFVYSTFPTPISRPSFQRLSHPKEHKKLVPASLLSIGHYLERTFPMPRHCAIAMKNWARKHANFICTRVNKKEIKNQLTQRCLSFIHIVYYVTIPEKNLKFRNILCKPWAEGK